jgi:hypothetical protein
MEIHVRNMKRWDFVEIELLVGSPFLISIRHGLSTFPYELTGSTIENYMLLNIWCPTFVNCRKEVLRISSNCRLTKQACSVEGLHGSHLAAVQKPSVGQVDILLLLDNARAWATNAIVTTGKGSMTKGFRDISAGRVTFLIS